MNLGWIGAGPLGNAIALRLLKEEFRLTVWNRTLSKLAQIKEAGADIANDRRDVGHTKILFLCLPSSEIAEAILFEGKNPVFPASCPVVVDISTTGPDGSQKLRERLEARGVAFLTCPVSGGPEGAASGKLAAMASGSKVAWEQSESVIRRFARTATYLGPGETAQILKVCNNLAEAINLWGAAEAISLAQKYGLDIPTIYSILSEARGWSTYMGVLFDRISNPDSPVSASLETRTKDLHLAINAAADRDAFIPIGQMVTRKFASVVADFGGGADQSTCFKWINSKDNRAHDESDFS